jgi:hypothetical protein
MLRANTLAFIQEINAGIRQAMNIVRTRGNLSPGVLSEMQNVEQMMAAVEGLYGRVPNTPEARMQSTTDRTVAESIQLLNEAYQYANAIDPEAESIKNYAHGVSPLGAQRLTAQSLDG